jgi:AcrR family transcriptional regulator
MLLNEKVELLMERFDVTRKGALRIVKIVEAGVEVLRVEGFTALTKRRIAKRLGISDGNVSYYFPTRESLWQAVIDFEMQTFYDRHYSASDNAEPGAEAQFDALVRRWFQEYKDRDVRLFFAQLLAFAEVSEYVAKKRDAIYQRFFDETQSRIRAIDPTISDSALQSRTILVMAVLEGLHAVTAFKRDISKSDAAFFEELQENVNAIARGQLGA